VRSDQGSSPGRTRRRAVRRRATWTAALLVAGLCARPALAQPDTAATAAPAARALRPATPGGIKYGKWAAAAIAAVTTAVGIHEHNAANNAYAGLVGYCSQIAICRLAPDGRYADARAEAAYQQVVRDDRAARVWLVAGQASAVAAAVLFVLELRNARGPPNIPYAGLLVEPGLRETKVGFRWSLGW